MQDSHFELFLHGIYSMFHEMFIDINCWADALIQIKKSIQYEAEENDFFLRNNVFNVIILYCWYSSIALNKLVFIKLVRYFTISYSSRFLGFS